MKLPRTMWVSVIMLCNIISKVCSGYKPLKVPLQPSWSQDGSYPGAIRNLVLTVVV